ncbi:MAG: response regulator [Crocinitomicaceae bacterium]
MSRSSYIKITFYVLILGFIAYFIIQKTQNNNPFQFTEHSKSQFNNRIIQAETFKNIQLDSAQIYAHEAYKLAKQFNRTYERYTALLISSEIKFLRVGASDQLYEKADKCHEWFTSNAHYEKAFRAKYLALEIKSFLKGTNNIREDQDQDALIAAAKKCHNDSILAHAYYFKMEMRDYSRTWEDDVHILDSARLLAQRSKDTVLLSKIRMMSVLPINGHKASFDSTFVSLYEAQKWDSPELKCISYERLGVQFAPLQKIDSALYYLTNGIKCSDEWGSQVHKLFAYENLILSYMYVHEQDSILKYAQSALAMEKSTGRTQYEKDILKKIGIAWMHKNEYSKAVEPLQRALKITNENNDEEGTFGIQRYLVGCLLKARRLDESEKFLSKMSDWITSKETSRVNEINRSGVLYLYGRLMEERKQLDSAMYFFEECASVCIKNNLGAFHQLQSDYMIISLSLKMDNIQKALEKRDQMVSIYPESYLRGEFQFLEGTLMYRLDRHDESLKALETFLNSTDEIASEDRSSSCRILSEIYRKKGDFRQALIYSEKSREIDKEINKISDALEVEKVQSKNDLLEKEAEISQLHVDRLEKENLLGSQQNTLQRRRTLIISLSVLLLLLGVIIYFIYNRSKEARVREALKQKTLEKEKQLEQLKAEESKRSFELKNQLFSNISHEFRTPLTLIKAPIEKLIEHSTDEDQNDLKIVKRNAEHLLLMVDEILELSLLDAGNAVLKKKAFELTHFIQEQQINFEPLFLQNGVHFEVVLPSESVKVLADEYRLKMVVNNLLKNAFQHTPKGGNVQLKTTLDREKQLFELELVNSGDWINADFLPFIFDRYARSQEKEYTGYGIGLSFCKEIIVLHDGKITAKNVQGGVCFSFTIPAEIEAIESTIVLSNEKVLSQESSDLTNHQQNTLLIVEDNLEMQYLLKSLLDKEYTILFANNGEEGIEIAQESQPDLIISDIMMPKIDGAELAKTLKNQFSTSHIPIILLTAKAADRDRISGLEIGVDDYLTKPFSPEELKVRIKNLIEQREQLRKRFSQNIFLAPEEITSNSLDQEFLIRATSIIQSNLLNASFNVEFFCQELALNRNSVHQKLKSLTGRSASQFINSIRLKESARLLTDQLISIQEVSELSGFNSIQSFNKVFKKHFEMTPSEYRKSVL